MPMKISNSKIEAIVRKIIATGLLIWLHIFLNTSDPLLERFEETVILLSSFNYVNKIEITYNDEIFLFYGDVLSYAKEFLNPSYSGTIALETDHIVADKHNILLSIRYYIDETRLLTAHIIREHNMYYERRSNISLPIYLAVLLISGKYDA